MQTKTGMLRTSFGRTVLHSARPCTSMPSAVGKDGDAPDRSFRQRREGARNSRNSERRSGSPVPGLLPVPTGPPNTEREQAAMDELVQGMSDEERVQAAAAMEAQNDAVLAEYFETMAPEKQQKLIESLRINKYYSQPHVWEEMLLQPIMKDMMREAIGPELSSIMDKLLGGPGWVDADRAEDSPLPLSEVRRRLSLLRPEEREQVPVLFAELEDWQAAYDRMGHIVDAEEAAERKAKKVGQIRLQRLAREKGLPDPTEGYNPSEGDSSDDKDDELDSVQRDRTREASSSGSGSSRGKKGSTRLSKAAARSAARKQARMARTGGVDAVVDTSSIGSTGSSHGVHGSSSSSSSSSSEDTFGLYGGSEERSLNGGSEERGTWNDTGEGVGRNRGEEASRSSTSSSGSSGARSRDRHTAEDGGHAGGSGGRREGGESVSQSNENAVREAAMAAGLSGEMATVVGRLEHTYRRYNQEDGPGWREDGYLGSADMQCLENITSYLNYASQLKDHEALAQAGVSVQELAGGLEEAFGELQALMQRWKGGFVLDGPTISCLIFLETQLLQPSSDSADGNLELPVDPEIIEGLSLTIRAAHSFEAVLLFARNWEDRQPAMPLATALEQYGYSQSSHEKDGGDAGFVGGYSTLWWAARDQDKDGPDTVCQPLVADWERIESLAAMDASMLRCCSELETQGYTEEVLMKWSLHPAVGPRLRSGEPLIQPEDLPSDMQPLFAQSIRWRVEGLDYDIKMLRSSDPNAKPAAARLQQELARLEAQLQGQELPDEADGRQDGVAQQQLQQQQQTGLKKEGKRIGSLRIKRLQRQQQQQQQQGFGGARRAAPRDVSHMGQGEEASAEATWEEPFVEQLSEDVDHTDASVVDGQVPPPLPRDAAKAAAIARAKERGQVMKRTKKGKKS